MVLSLFNDTCFTEGVILNDEFGKNVERRKHKLFSRESAQHGA
jgi:hypothetical protein